MSFKTPIGFISGQRRTGVGVSGVPYFPHPNINNGYGTFAWTADLIKCAPFLCPRRLTLSGIAIRVTTIGTATLARLGIYKDNGNFQPGALLADFGTVDVTTTGLKEISGLSQQLEANRLYWTASWYNGGVTLNVNIPSNIVNCLGMDPVTIQQGVSEFQVATAFGVFPNPITPGGVYNTGGTRIVFLRF